MRTLRLALVGFGNVGVGFAQILRDEGDRLAEQFGLRLQIVAVNDVQRGSVYDPAGLDPQALLAAVAPLIAGARSSWTPRQTGPSRGDGLPAAAGLPPLNAVPAAYHGWNTAQTIADTQADVVLELTYTDLRTGEPAARHIRLALASGKHVVTTNKGPVALHFAELDRLARSKNLEFAVEGTVMSGTPTLRLGRELLAAAGIRRVYGIFNGTTNYILTQMGQGASYEAALAEAQAKGYAEADPTGDVEGYDAAGKVVILANLLMGGGATNMAIGMADVTRQGITGLTVQDIADATATGECWKLIGSVERGADGALVASVGPIRIPLKHPLAAVNGATNAIVYTTDLLGDVTIIGPGAGRRETGFALLGDLLAIARRYA